MTVRLDGKAIVITGSGRGIGAACAKEAASLGALVVVNDIEPANAQRVAESIREGGGTAIAQPADVSSREQAATLIARCVQEFGRIDGLVNNAALMVLGRLQTYDETRLRRLLEVNVVGAFNCAAEAIGYMYDQRGGSIINVTSGAHLGLSDMSDYAATKGAIASMTYAWAADAAGTNVRVNALSPLADSPMSANAHSYYRGQGMLADITVPPDAATNAPVVSYLLSDASIAVRGQVVRVAGTALSLMSHPAILAPTLTRARWTGTDVQRAFDQLLTARQVPVGLTYQREPALSAPPDDLDFL